MKLRKKELLETTDEDVKIIYSQYSAFRYKKIIAMVALFAILLIASLYGMTVGSYPITMGEVYQIIVDHLFDLGSPLENIDQRVVWDQRMPRLLTAIVAGAGLAVIGLRVRKRGEKNQR